MATVECGKCAGTGTYDAECPGCEGTGREYGFLGAAGVCIVCGGSGREPTLCWKCDGTGQLQIAAVGVDDDAGDGDLFGRGW